MGKQTRADWECLYNEFEKIALEIKEYKTTDERVVRLLLSILWEIMKIRGEISK